MVQPLSQDLRVRVVAALGDGLTVRAAAARFGILVAGAVRLGQRSRSGQGLAPGKTGGHRRPLLTQAAEAVTARLAAKSDWTVRALAADLATDGIKVSHDTVWRYLRSQRLSFKKNSAGERDRSAEASAPAGALERPPPSA
jgi:transposase